MKMNSHITTLLAALAVFILSLGCGGDSSDSVTTAAKDFTAEEPFEYDVNVVNQILLIITGINGEVDITGRSNATTATISATKRVESNISNADAQRQLHEIEVNVLAFTNEVTVETVQPKDADSRNYVVDYAITLPKNMQVQVVNVNGAVILDSIENDVTVNGVNGAVTILGAIGSSSVNIVNGAIDCKVTLPLNNTVDLNTVNGNINLSIPTTTSADFSAKVSNGGITTSGLLLQNEVSTATTHSGLLGSGQGTISLMAVNGNIAVSGF